jgi:hypothetical protein
VIKIGVETFSTPKKAIFEGINPLVVTVIAREYRFAQSADDERLSPQLQQLHLILHGLQN